MFSTLTFQFISAMHFVFLSCVKEIRENEILFSVSLTVLGFEIWRNYSKERSIKYLESSLLSREQIRQAIGWLLTKNILLICVIHMSFFSTMSFLLKIIQIFHEKMLPFHSIKINYNLWIFCSAYKQISKASKQICIY